MKKTLLTIIAALLLGGVVNAQGWGETDSHAKSSNTPIVASVKLDGNAVTPNASYRLGAFVGEELRGIAAQHTDDNFWIQVFYNQGTNETITFKFYDGTQEYTTCSVTKATQEEGWGTPTNPVVLDFATTQTQSMTLAQGWSWWSTPIEMNNVDGLTLLENSMGADGYFIRNQNGLSVEYDPDWGWWGDEFEIRNESMYEIKMSNTKTATIAGTWANPASHPISISNGWNWIGYPEHTSLEINEAFSSLSSCEDDILQTRNDGYSIYVPDYGFWGDIEYMVPGNGYKYKYMGTQSQTFTYPSNRNHSSNVIQSNVAVSPESASHQYMMNVIASVELNDVEIESEGYEIIALFNGESRGRAKLRYCEPTGHYVALLTIYSDKSERLQFQLEDVNNNITYLGDETVLFESELVLGSLKSPYPIHFGNVGINGMMLTNIFPNPTDKGRVLSIDMTGCPEYKESCVVELFNSVGEKVSMETSSSNPISVKAPNVAGIYVVRLTIDRKFYYGKIVVID